MSSVVRFFWLITLIFFVGGCSSYKAVSSLRIADGDDGWEFPVEVGDKVKITLMDDTQVEGKIMEISNFALTLEPAASTSYTGAKKNTPGDYLPREIAGDSIRALEKREHSGGKTGLLIGGIVVGLLGLLGIAIAASGGVTTGM